MCEGLGDAILEGGMVRTWSGPAQGGLQKLSQGCVLSGSMFIQSQPSAPHSADAVGQLPHTQ